MPSGHALHYRTSASLCVIVLALLAGACASPSRQTDSPAARESHAQAVGQPMHEGAPSLVIAALNFLDVPYRRGGNDAEGFDCSGFTRHLFEAHLGVTLPRRADEQARARGLVAVTRDELLPGDLVFFNTLRRTFSHVGIYVGNGRFIHAPRPGAEVRVESMGVAYWSQRFTGARRAPATQARTSLAPPTGSTFTSPLPR